jgi:DNA-binding CsgD family transcriptional regulator
LSDSEREAIRRLADIRTLRELGAEFGVSHETVRAVLREGGATAAAAAR